MANRKIVIYKTAKADLEDIVDYINRLSSAATIKQYDNIIEKISSLAEIPEKCPYLKDSNLRLKGYRFLVIDQYLVFFVVKDNTVQIRRILYGKRNYEWLL